MNRAIIIIAVLTSTSLVAFPQTKDAEGTTIGNVEKAARIRQAVSYPTMLDMTFPEFGAATAKTDIALLPICSIEEHGPKLPLSTDSVLAVAQLVDVQLYLRNAGIETVMGPPLNIGITNESGDWTRN